MNYKKDTKNNKNKESGFTLIETLVAITILVIAIIGPMEIASKSLFSAFYARDEITAYYLAQEGIEYVRNARDTLFLTDFNNKNLEGDWLRGLDNCIADENSTTGCYLDTTIPFSPDDFLASACPVESDGGCPFLKFDEDTGVYDYSSGVDSKFKRNIVLVYKPHGEAPLDKEEVIVISNVTWSTGSFFKTNRSFVLSERLYNWQR